MKDSELQTLFSFTPLGPGEQEKIGQIREAGYRLAQIANEVCPEGPLKESAIHDLHRTVMTFNSCVAHG